MPAKKAKSNKSLTKRIKITRTGKVVRRSMGVNHFRTRKTQKNIRGKRKTRGLDFPFKKIINY